MIVSLILTEQRIIPGPYTSLSASKTAFLLKKCLSVFDSGDSYETMHYSQCVK